MASIAPVGSAVKEELVCSIAPFLLSCKGVPGGLHCPSGLRCKGGAVGLQYTGFVARSDAALTSFYPFSLSVTGSSAGLT